MTGKSRIICVTVVAALGVACMAGAAPALNGRQVTTLRHVILVDNSALPKQINIRPEKSELPLDWRTPDSAPTDTDLQSIGRGPQLTAPVRLVARIDGKDVVASAATAATMKLDGETVKAAAQLKAGGVVAGVKTEYGDGLIHFNITYGGGGNVELLELVVPLAGTVDVAFGGYAVTGEGKPYSAAAFDVGQEEGVVWSNARREAGEVSPYKMPGMLESFFVGSGDRGFSFDAAYDAGWVFNTNAAMMTLERDKAGNVSWHIRIVNHPLALDGERTASFTLLIHPCIVRAADARPQGWRGRGQKYTFATTPDEAVPNERQFAGGLSCLYGPSGGDAGSPGIPLSDMFPIKLFRYLAGTHTGLESVLMPNGIKIVRAGGAHDLDRMALGRALLHDIGLVAGGLTHRVDAAVVVNALHRFGYFAGDSKTEYIPYWRSTQVIHYGELFNRADAFETTEQDPLARVYTSVFVRPGKRGKKKALIVIVNEGAEPVREQLYIENIQRLFGGHNLLKGRDLVAALDYSRIPEESDWRKGKMAGKAVPRGTKLEPKPMFALADYEDNGIAVMASLQKTSEVYGPIFVPAHGYRILFGTGSP